LAIGCAVLGVDITNASAGAAVTGQAQAPVYAQAFSSLTGASLEKSEQYENLAFLASSLGAGYGSTLSQIRGPAAVSINVSQPADHLVLGLSAHGLEETAKAVGGRHLMNMQNGWREEVLMTIHNPNARITVVLDGFSGSNTYQQVMGAASRGLKSAAKATEWEMAQLARYGRLPSVNFMRGGQAVENPFAKVN
jgi:hypothetical protein